MEEAWIVLQDRERTRIAESDGCLEKQGNKGVWESLGGGGKQSSHYTGGGTR